MSLPRFFVDAPTDAFAEGSSFTLPAKAAHHAGRALRLAAGERVEVFNGSGFAWSGPIGFSADSAWVKIDAVTEKANESPVFMTLVQSLVAPEKMEWIVEKAVETGISAILLVPAERSVTKLSGDRLAKRRSNAGEMSSREFRLRRRLKAGLPKQKAKFASCSPRERSRGYRKPFDRDSARRHSPSARKGASPARKLNSLQPRAGRRCSSGPAC